MWEKLLVILTTPSFRRWAMAVFAVLVLVVSDRVGFLLSDEQRSQLVMLVLGVLGLSNLNDMVTKRTQLAAKAGAEAAKPSTPTELNQ